MKLNIRNIRTKILLLVIIILLGAIWMSYTSFQERKKTLGANSRHILLGAWTEGLFDASSQTLHQEALLAFQQEVQKHVSIAHFYRGWEALSDPNLITQFNTLRSNGWEPMLNANPYYFSQCPASDMPLYRAIAQGKCDDFLHAAGKNLRSVNRPFFLLFAWEMNNPQNDWSVVHTGSTPEDFVAAWQHIHTIFAQEGAINVIWVFAPNVPDTSDVPYSSLYPGNRYVNWVGLDGYNWGITQSWSQWVSFSGVFGSSYNKITTIAPNKPLMLAEVNTTDQGGDKSQWYIDMLTQQIPYNFPKIQAVVIFNEDRTTQEHVNWRVDVTPQTLQAFIAGIHSSFY